MALKPIFESIDKCRICSSLKIQEILDLGDQPAANSLYPPGGKEPPYISKFNFVLSMVIKHPTTKMGKKPT